MRNKILEDGAYYGEIPGFDGVFPNAEILEGCQELLREVLEDWILLGLQMGHELPPSQTLIKGKSPRPC